ncbi:SDR family NAD(P)-dependent oxidoreductase [Bradyrhizobium sp. dw_78]|uniref:SDR family oxidoreductase n=1 Tax=Bradyrhizobium sp. dw_78 TaxID=2719793 RepID=UPI001BD425AD|nr:SDR family NAD(P)-dependent oxidoreductase [Bradyrhizobium sp. dw_78]
MKVSGNTILITGGTSGIGFELAKQFLALGNTVIVTGRDPSALEGARRKLPGLHVFRSDVSDPKAIADLYEQVTGLFPALNVLINNAGIMRQINLHDSGGKLEDLTREIDINLAGSIRMAARFLPHLKIQKSAAIMNVSSGLAFLPAPASPVYCATKAAVHSFTISLRVQLKRTNVIVFELAPPLTLTPLATGAFDEEDRKGIPVMSAETLARRAIEGIRKDRLEIRPGMSNVMKFISRVTPNGLLQRMISPTVDRMLAPLHDHLPGT